MIALTGAFSIWNSISGSLGPFVAANWKYILVGLLALALLFTTHEWQHEKGLLKIEKAAHAADIASYKKAQTDAEAKVAAEKAALIKQNTDQANEADAAYSDLLATYRSNLLRYQTNQGVRSGPSGSQSDNSTKSSNGPGTSAVIPQDTQPLTISGDDANICAVNTARLQAAHDWALTLENTNGKDASNETN